MLDGRPVVHVVGPTFGLDKLFSHWGYIGVNDRQYPSYQADVDLVCFTGGTDINPDLYNQERHPWTQPTDHARDNREVKYWKEIRDLPKVGICRGAQLINVLNGGDMIQHVQGHNGSEHEVITHRGETKLVCTVHHQMMVPSTGAELIAWAKGVAFEDGRKEPEVLWIPEDRALLFQAHPEFGPRKCTEYFLELMSEYIDPLLPAPPAR